MFGLDIGWYKGWGKLNVRLRAGGVLRSGIKGGRWCTKEGSCFLDTRCAIEWGKERIEKDIIVQIQMRDLVAVKKAAEKELVRFRVILLLLLNVGSKSPKAPCLCSHALKPMLR